MLASRADQRLPVQGDGYRFAPERDFEYVPLAERAVGVLDGDARSADFLRHAAIGAIAVDLTGSENLTPDVCLAL